MRRGLRKLERPVNRRGALLCEQVIRTGKRTRAEKAAMRRERGRMRRFNNRRIPEERFKRLGGPAPQDRDKGLAALGEHANGVVGDGLPAFAAMRVGGAGCHGENPVE